ncbi:hypothetical protein FPV67DRAFT_176912 [Lyophyllum atratum]|nr:hypothetical protein FPV67DRAFT_176912 [Lyophyllum atratum]
MRPTIRWHWHPKLLLVPGMSDRVRSRANDYEYPFNHSTYYTRRDNDPYTSELPPMNSEEDVLQDHSMNHRNFGRSSYLWPGGATRTKKRRGRLTRFFGKLKRGIQRGYWGFTDTLRGA